MHALLPIWVYSGLSLADFIEAGGKRPMTGDCATITVDEVDEYVDVVGSSTPGA